MKRSEFVYQLAGYLSTHDLFSEYHPGSLFIVDLADHITKYLEAQGMAPKTPQGTNFSPTWEAEAIVFGEDNLD